MTEIPGLPEGELRRRNGIVVALAAPGAGLETLPDAVAKLTSLRHIDLDGNALTRLPPTVTALPHLETLLLYRNRLTRLPPRSAA